MLLEVIRSISLSAALIITVIYILSISKIFKKSAHQKEEVKCCENCEYLKVFNDLYAKCIKNGWNFYHFTADTRNTRCGMFKENKGGEK